MWRRPTIENWVSGKSNLNRYGNFVFFIKYFIFCKITKHEHIYILTFIYAAFTEAKYSL